MIQFTIRVKVNPDVINTEVLDTEGTAASLKALMLTCLTEHFGTKLFELE